MQAFVPARKIDGTPRCLSPVNRNRRAGTRRRHPRDHACNLARSSSEPHRHADMAAAQIRAAHKIAAHRRGCGASAVRPACSLLRAPRQPPIAPSARRCRGCGNAWRRGHPRSGRARRPASSSPAGCRAAGSRRRRRRVLRDHELDVRIAVDLFERLEIGRRQRIFEPLARRRRADRRPASPRWCATSSRRARRMVTEEISAMMFPRKSQRAGGRPSDRSASPIQRRTAA